MSRTRPLVQVLGIWILVLLGTPRVPGQQTYYWRSEASNGNWQQSGNWFHTDNNSSSDIPGGNENLNFNNNVDLTMTNDLANTSRYRINFFSGSGTRIINGSNANTFFDFSGNVPAIYNNSGNTQTINFEIIDGNSNGTNRLELNADSSSNTGSNLVFGGDVSASGGTRTVVTMGSGNVSISGKVTQETSSTLNFRTEGSGTVTLSGANNYTGTTSVTAGTLLVNGDQSSATGAVSVTNSGTVLGGIGTIGGGSTINAGTKITGATVGTVGTLTLGNNLTFSGSSGSLAQYVVDISGSTSDRLAIGSALDLSGTFDQISFSGTANGTSSYTLATYASLSGTFDTVTGLPTGYQLDYGAMALTLEPVPEPSTWMAGALALGAVAFSQRRKFPRLFHTLSR